MSMGQNLSQVTIELLTMHMYAPVFVNTSQQWNLNGFALVPWINKYAVLLIFLSQSFAYVLVTKMII